MWFKKKPAPLSINDVPVGLAEFYTWCDEVIDLTRLPANDSMRFAVATIVLESKDILSKDDAARRLVKAAQNQLAAFVFQDIKSKRMAADEAAAKLAQADAAIEKQEATEVNESPEAVSSEVQAAPSPVVSET